MYLKRLFPIRLSFGGCCLRSEHFRVNVIGPQKHLTQRWSEVFTNNTESIVNIFGFGTYLVR